MVSLELIQQDLDKEAEWDIYTKDYSEDLVENDAIDAAEAGFLQGYDSIYDDSA